MLNALIGPVTGLLDKFIPDKDQALKLAHELSTMVEKHAHEIAKQQIEVNKIDAASGSKFQAWWRPAAGWICVTAMGWHYLLAPIVASVLPIFGVAVPAFPEFDMSSLMTLLLGMLGLGSLRSFERIKGKGK
jgi:hypothetical protein